MKRLLFIAAILLLIGSCAKEKQNLQFELTQFITSPVYDIDFERTAIFENGIVNGDMKDTEKLRSVLLAVAESNVDDEYLSDRQRPHIRDIKYTIGSYSGSVIIHYGVDIPEELENLLKEIDYLLAF